MFDLRYHVASLTAVFVALVIGILVGVGLSGKGFVNDAERANLTRQIADLRQERDAAQQSLESASRVEQALNDFAEGAYPAVVPGRLRGQRIAVLFVGPIDRGVSFAVGKAVRDAGGTVVRTRSIGVPVDTKAVQDVLRRQPALSQLFPVFCHTRGLPPDNRNHLNQRKLLPPKLLVLPNAKITCLTS